MTEQPPHDSDHVTLLRNLDLFAGLDRVTLAKLAAYLEPLQVRDGEAVVRYGEPSDALYLVSRGTFTVHVRPSEQSEEVRIARLNKGDSIGEIGLLLAEPRSATVRALNDGEVLRLERDRFLSLIRQDPSVAVAIAATLSRRLTLANLALSGRDHSAAFGEADWAERRPAPGAVIDTSRTTPDLNAAMGAPGALLDAARRMLSRTTSGVILTTGILALGWVLAPPSG